VWFDEEPTELHGCSRLCDSVVGGEWLDAPSLGLELLKASHEAPSKVGEIRPEDV